MVDNDAAWYGAIKGQRPSKASPWMLALFWGVETSIGCLTWFDPVPSKSNIADGPSRLEFSRVAKLAGRRVRVVNPNYRWDDLLATRRGLGV